MPGTPDLPPIFLTCLRAAIAAIVGVMLCGTVAAQGLPPTAAPPQQQAAPPANPMCPRLEAQLATIDRGGADAGRAEQMRRYEESASRQQSELDRITAQAKKMGCDSSGFFSLFSGQSAQCGPVNNQIQQMRANLDQITGNLEKMRGGPGNAERDSQRRSVLLALAQNNCGPQYAAAARAPVSGSGGGPGGFLGGLFGNNESGGSGGQVGAPSDSGPPSGTYRTVCVRTCDGFYFPISFATTQSRFADDEKTCKSLCPASEAALFSYRNPGEDINAAVSVSGQPYTSSPNAFKYRQEFNPSCSCKAQGQTWSDALKAIDDKSAAEQQGDIIVTEERAKKMAQPPTKAAPAATKKAASTTAASAPAIPVAPAAADPTPAADGSKSIRSVGPTFIPAR